MKRRVILLIGFLSYSMLNVAYATKVLTNTYHIKQQPTENTIFDSAFYDFASYFVFKNDNKLTVEKNYDKSSYRLNKHVMLLVDYVNELDTTVVLNFYSNKNRYTHVGEVAVFSDSIVVYQTSKQITSNKQFVTLTLLPKQTIHACLLYQPISFKDYYFKRNANDFYLYKSKFHFPVFDSFLYKRNVGYSIQYLFLLGVIFIMYVFYMLSFFYLKDKIYLFYSFYLLISFLQVLYMIQYEVSRNMVMFNFIGNSGFDEATKGLMIFFYMQFYKEAFRISKKDGSLFYSVELLKIISLLYVFVIIIAYLFNAGWYAEPIIYGIYRVPILLLSVIAFYFTMRLKTFSFFQKIILSGSIVYLLFNIVSTIQKTDFLLVNFLLEINTLYLGILFELIFFSIALIIRIKDSFLASEALKDKLIVELKQNEEFVKNENLILESKVKERVVEIEKQNEIIEDQRRQALFENFEKEKALIQMQALSSQMNPHFIFNCMSAIQKSIITNEVEKASSLLTDFASLIRMVLQNSTKPEISLSNEIELLDQYLKLEQNRLSDSFDYTIIVENEIQTDFVEIPNMMLQPALENAIWHGFRDINYKGRIDISFSQHDNLIRCTIIDNGIGRIKAAKYQSVHQQSSLAIEIILNRIKLLNQTNKNGNGNFEIVDLYNEQKQAIGTKVIIDLLILKN